MKNILTLSLLGVLVSGCGVNTHLKGLPEAELLEAALESQRLVSEMTLKVQICNSYGLSGFEAQAPALEFRRELMRAHNYYENQTRSFNKKVRHYLQDYESQYANEHEMREKIYQAHFNINLVTSRLNTAKYFGADTKEVKAALSEENHMTYSSRLNPNSEIIIQVLAEKERSIVSKCEKLVEDIFDDKYQPDFSKYNKEYKEITGMNSLQISN